MLETDEGFHVEGLLRKCRLSSCPTLAACCSHASAQQGGPPSFGLSLHAMARYTATSKRHPQNTEQNGCDFDAHSDAGRRAGSRLCTETSKACCPGVQTVWPLACPLCHSNFVMARSLMQAIELTILACHADAVSWSSVAYFSASGCRISIGVWRSNSYSSLAMACANSMA